MNHDWTDDARKIPPWVGAKVCLLGRRIPFLVSQITRTGAWVVHRDYAGVEHHALFEDIRHVALEDPDTQAAYLRRLAIRWGCPLDLVSVGVVFVRSPGDPWRLLAGDLEADVGDAGRWSVTLLDRQDDRLLALARAWPERAMTPTSPTPPGPGRRAATSNRAGVG